MTNIPCSIIKDLLPLYIDGVLTDESAQLVRTHLADCPACQQEHDTLTQALTLPVSPDIQAEDQRTLKNFRRQLQKKQCEAIIATALVIIFAIASTCIAYTQAGAFHDLISPNITITLRHIQTDDWRPLAIGENGCLNFPRLFAKKEAIVDANSDAAATLRISDMQGNIIIDELTIRPGESTSLSALKSGTDYHIEVKAHADFIFIRFI